MRSAIVFGLIIVQVMIGMSKASHAIDKWPDIDVLAIVDGKKSISLLDYYAEVSTLPDHLKPIAETQDGRKEMLETMIIKEMILLEAYTEGIDKDRAVKEKLAELKRRLIVEVYLRKHVESYKGDRNEAFQKVKATVKSRHKSTINTELLSGIK
jgi:peptidyl-prolyl cis-trans isomerase C